MELLRRYKEEINGDLLITDFNIKERDDEGTIEELNNQLLGIQTAGFNENINKAKNHFITGFLLKI